MDQGSYPRPPPFTWTYVPPRKLLPVYPPPEPLSWPSLPSPPRIPSFDAPFTLSTHLCPAAYLRTTRFKSVPPFPPGTLPKLERRQILEKISDELKSMEIRGSTITDGYPQVLWNCINRYVRKGLRNKSEKGLTLFFAHANGFPKEIWEPVLGDLLSSPAGQHIDEIWSWESVQHGDAAIINGKNLSSIFDWTDNTRDILNFLFNFMPSEALDTPLQVHLQRVPLEESSERQHNGFRDRKFMAVGHSYGGCTSALAAILYPKLFSGLFLVDPVIVIPSTTSKRSSNLAVSALGRRQVWSSKQEAYDSFKNNPFFAIWDTAALKIYVECGIYETVGEDGIQVAKLKMPSIQEAVVFAETHTEAEVYQQMPDLDERIPLRWAVPGREDADEFGSPGSRQRRVWLRPVNSSNIRIEGAGHLIPQEQPHKLARDIGEFILRHHLPAVSYSKPNL